MSNLKEYCIYCIYYGGRPFILDTFSDITSAKLKLYDIVSLEEERNRAYYVDNDFFENKYNSSLRLKYFCIKSRNISEWVKFSDNEINNKTNNNIIYFNELKKSLK